MDLSEFSIEPGEDGYPFTLTGKSGDLVLSLRSPHSEEVVRAGKAAEWSFRVNADNIERDIDDKMGDYQVRSDLYRAAAAIITFGGMTLAGEEIETEAKAREAFMSNDGARFVGLLIARELDRIDRDFQIASKASSNGRDTSDISTPPQKAAKTVV